MNKEDRQYPLKISAEHMEQLRAIRKAKGYPVSVLIRHAIAVFLKDPRLKSLARSTQEVRYE